MEDRRCKLGLQGRLELVRLIEQGRTLRQAAACVSVAPATAHRWWHRWRAASPADRASLACLPTRSTRPRSCPWALSVDEERAILDARKKTNWGPMRLTWLTGRHRSTCWKVLHRHGVSRQRRTERPQTTRRYERTEAGALLHIDASSCPSSTGPATGPTATAPSATGPARPAEVRSSALSTTTPAWPTARCTPAKPPKPSPSRSRARRRGCANRAADRSKRS
jgi:leucine-zipper of insertion element IS481